LAVVDDAVVVAVGCLNECSDECTGVLQMAAGGERGGATALSRLDLERNSIGPAGAQSLARGLALNKSLKWLSLRDNQIGNPGAHALGKALATNNTLETIFIGGNDVDDSLHW
jgi:hypothetical protein